MRFFGNHTPHYHLYTDNQAAEHIATQPTMSEHSRSIDLRHHSIRQDYIDNNMRIGGVSSKVNTADILTKSLQPDLHTTHTSSLFPDRHLPATHTPVTNSDSRTSSGIFNNPIADTLTIPIPTARPANNGWNTYFNRDLHLFTPSNKKLPETRNPRTNTQTSQNRKKPRSTASNTQNKGRNINRKRQKFPTSSFYSPTPVPTPFYHNTTKHRTPTKLSQTKLTQRPKMKGGKGAHALQHK